MKQFSRAEDKKKTTRNTGFRVENGPDRIRTDDPHNANVMRSQLRYRPIPNVQSSTNLN